MADRADLLGARDVLADSRGRIGGAGGETSGLAADRAAAGAVPGEGESGVADWRRRPRRGSLNADTGCLSDCLNLELLIVLNLATGRAWRSLPGCRLGFGVMLDEPCVSLLPGPRQACLAHVAVAQPSRARSRPGPRRNPPVRRSDRRRSQSGRGDRSRERLLARRDLLDLLPLLRQFEQLPEELPLPDIFGYPPPDLVRLGNFDLTEEVVDLVRLRHRKTLCKNDP